MSRFASKKFFLKINILILLLKAILKIEGKGKSHKMSWVIETWERLT